MFSGPIPGGSLAAAGLIAAGCGSTAHVVALTAGSGYTCALIAGGTVECWGDGASGELGASPDGDAWAPVTVSGLGGVSAITAGLNHACAITSNGDVECWGNNSRGQLGRDSPSPAPPDRVTNLPLAVAVTAGDDDTCAMTADGEVRCWGINDFGQLGVSSVLVRSSSRPIEVDGLDGTTKISARGENACAVLKGGSVKCWGLNLSGQLGNGNDRGPALCRPFAPAPCSTVPVVTALLTDATEVSPGSSHACALRSDGSVACWGDNRNGQLGLGDGDGPERCGGEYFEGLSAGPCSTTPRAVVGLNQVTAIAAGNGFTCALIAHGTVECWGVNDQGQLGNGTTAASAAPTFVQELVGVTSIAVGDDHACALLADGAVACWGSNLHGALGSGATRSSNIPTRVIL